MKKVLALIVIITLLSSCTYRSCATYAKTNKEVQSPDSRL
jgi:hypothetical protein